MQGFKNAYPTTTVLSNKVTTVRNELCTENWSGKKLTCNWNFGRRGDRNSCIIDNKQKHS